METENTSVEDLLNIHRTARNETTLASEIHNIMRKRILLHLATRKKPVQILRDKFIS